jgi:hypothetical protein
VVDAHLVIVALRLGEDILTGDLGNFGRLVDGLPDERRPRVVAWP